MKIDDMLFLSFSNDVHNRLLAQSDMIQKRTICRAGITARTTLNTVHNIESFGIFPILVQCIAHQESRIQPHRAN